MRLFLFLSIFCILPCSLLANRTEEWTGPTDERLTAVYDRMHEFRIRGNVLDVFPDDIDTDYVCLVVDREGEIIYAPVVVGNTQPSEFEKLVGAEVEFDARVCIVPASKTIAVGRLFTGPLFLVQNIRQIRVTTPPTPTPFDVPELGDLSKLSPARICSLGRRRLTGVVTAVWNRRSLLVDAGSNRTVRVELATPDLPAWGSTIEAVGFVGTDVFRLNLNRAIWRPAEPSAMPDTQPMPVELGTIFRNERGKRQFRFSCHGKVIRVRGLVRSLPASDDAHGLFMIEADGTTLPVNTSSCPEARDNLAIGATVEATGVCVMDVEGWRPNDLFPPIRGPFLVVRQARDIQVISRPPWLTPVRALSLVLALVAVMIGILIWNRTLKIVANRRGRALLRQEIENVRSQMSVLERTRLAVELHDSIAQTLTGVALELEAASLSSKTSHQKLEQHLNIAARALDSCRDSLRNCLWDLRNDALDEPTMNEAIRRTLLPHCKGIAPAIRFSVPRSYFSDNTTHAILCIIRELVLNALRHGKATDIRVAGAHDDDAIAFSVQDNGRGFDPNKTSGVADGHFGLQGIRERVHKIGGALDLSSAPGRGAKATVTIRMPKRKELK